MCYGCWQEMGKPAIVTEATKAAAEAVRALYEINAVGGAMHIVTDDWNIEDHSLEFCSKEIEAGDHWSFKDAGAREAAKLVCDLMSPMTEDERASVLALESGFIGDDGTEPPMPSKPLVPFNVFANPPR
jgi:hypothetical protein